MNICSSCGVELDEDIVECPLCRNKPGSQPEDQPAAGSFPSDIIRVYKKEVSRNVWELTGIISLSGIIVCTLVDLVIGKGLKWSLYADVSLLFVWITISIILTEFRKSVLVLPSLMVNTLALLFLFDLFSQKTGWFLPVGLPITVAFFISAGIIVLLRKVFNFRGFSILGFTFLVLMGFCIVSEVFIDKFIFGSVNVSWSVIAGAAIFPIALILFFIHFRMNKGKRLDSFFHV
jgi:hypothetical protein